jgi:hypothetical protein
MELPVEQTLEQAAAAMAEMLAKLQAAAVLEWLYYVIQMLSQLVIRVVG